MLNLRDTLIAAFDEATISRRKYGSFSSAHEAFGVLAEEVSELLDALHRNDQDGIARESLQVAAVAARLSHEIRTEPEMMVRSGIQ